VLLAPAGSGRLAVGQPQATAGINQEIDAG
jgi:hypothetical protein